MIVVCPECSTQFRLNAERVQGAHPSLKCSRCGYVFSLPRTKKQPASRPARPREDRQLKLGGDEWSIGDVAEKVARDDTAARRPQQAGEQWPARDGDAPAELVALDDESGGEVAEPRPSRPSSPRRRSASERDENVSVPPIAAKHEEDPIIAGDGDDFTFAADDGNVDAPEDASDEIPEFAAIPEPEVEAAKPKPRQPAKPAPRRPVRRTADVAGWLAFCAIVVVGYMAVTAVFLARPMVATQVLASFAPFADLAETVALGRSVGLEEIRSSYQRIKEDRREVNRELRHRKTAAFVVAGTARNGARQAVRDIRVRGRLYDEAGTVIGEKEIHCGVAVSPEVLAATDAYGVSVLERIQPPPRFAVSPGDSAEFVIAFVDPPAAVAGYTVEVVSALPAHP